MWLNRNGSSLLVVLVVLHAFALAPQGEGSLQQLMPGTVLALTACAHSCPSTDSKYHTCELCRVFGSVGRGAGGSSICGTPFTAGAAAAAQPRATTGMASAALAAGQRAITRSSGAYTTCHQKQQQPWSCPSPYSSRCSQRCLPPATTAISAAVPAQQRRSADEACSQDVCVACSWRHDTVLPLYGCVGFHGVESHAVV